MRQGRFALGGLIATLALCAPAQAGTFEVSSCGADFGANPNHRFDGWTTLTSNDPVDDPYFNHAETCGQPGGGLLSSTRRTLHSAAGNTQYRFWVFTAPSGATITHLALWHFGAARTANTAVTLRRVRGDGSLVDFADTRCTSSCTPPLGALAQSALSPTNRSDYDFPPSDGTTTVSDLLYCSPGGGDCAASDGSNPGGEMNIYGAIITMSENGAPEVADPHGPLWTDGFHAGTERVSLTARDSTSGVAKTRLFVDGKLAGEHQQACDAGRATPCPTTVDDSFELDTAQLGGGPHTLALTAVDQAGNESAADATTHSLLVLGHFPNGNGATPAATLRAYFARNGHAKYRTRRSGTARVKGILRGDGKQGIAGATLTVATVVAGAGGTTADLPPVSTDSKGRFSFVVPGGPSRRVVVGYRAFADDPQPAQVRTLALTVPTGIALKASPHHLRIGRRVHLRGRVLAPFTPAGLLLNIQAFDRGRWVTAGATHTQPGGTFSWRYRFKRTRTATTYPFRVQLRRQGTFPYGVSYSNVTRVRVG